MKLGREDVQKIATLARLNFSEEELDRFANQLSSILDYIERLNQLDTDKVKPTAYTLTEVTPFREDKVYTNQARETILENAPDREDNLFRVPKVI